MDLITTNQRVFEVYLGLTTSGYDLGNPNRITAMHKSIQAADWSQQTLQYFRYACVNDGRINPYWPRASILTLVGILIDLEPSNFNKVMIRTHLAGIDNISPEDMDDDVINWAGTLIEQMMSLRGSQSYADAWACYQQIVQDEIRKKGNQYQTEILSAQDRLFDLLPFQSSPLKMTTILNPLQADPLTDIVSVQNCHYVVTSHLRTDSFIHELIHLSIDPYLSVWKDQLLRNMDLLDSAYEPMAHLSYAWDHSYASWQNVFSETLVRVLTLLVSENEDLESQKAQIETLVQQGFIYARPIAETITMIKGVQPLSDEWLKECLRACTLIAK